MVENRLNPNISFFLTLMHSPIIGDRNIISGHAIYNALLRWTNISPKDIEKVSFGIPQNNTISLKGSAKYLINVSEEPKTDISKRKSSPKTILDNLDKGYDGFKVIRNTENVLSNPLYDFSPIPFEVIKNKRGQSMIVHKIDYFVFFIIWKNIKPEIDFTNVEFTLGYGRNNGFGFSRIERVYDTNMEKLIIDIEDREKFTAINGIRGIYNHAKYGFGEYILETTGSGIKIINTITPLCMSSTFPNSTQYGTLPQFVKAIPYTKVNYSIWDKGTEHNLKVIRSGKVFEVLES